MNEYSDRIKNLLIIVGVFLLLLAGGWVLTPYKPIFLGLLIGTIVSLINTLHLALRINRLGHSTATGTKRKIVSLGATTRYSIVILAALLAIKFPELISLFSLTLSLLFVPILALVEAIVTSKKHDTWGKG